MFRKSFLTTGFIAALLLSTTCSCRQGTTDSSSSNGDSQTAKSTVTDHGHEHSHSENDKLVWGKEDISIDDYVVSLGHHGNHFHFGDSIEPAVMITKSGDDVSDAKVQNCLVSAEDSATLTDLVDLVFEPKTEQEPAHYAQGALEIPKDKGKFQIKFTIQFPGDDQKHDFVIDVNAH